MIFSNGTKKLEPSFAIYNTTLIENVSEYKFLGLTIKPNGNLGHSTVELVKRAKKALFSIKTYSKSLTNLPPKVACNLFDSLVKPIMIYNAEITYLDTYLSFHRAKKRAKNTGREVDSLSFIDKSPIEKVHIAFCKYILGVKKNASNLAARCELGRLPVESCIKTQTLLYLNRFNRNDLNPLLLEAFELTKILDQEGIYTWYTYAKQSQEETDISYQEINSQSKAKNQYKRSVKTFYENLFYKKLNKIEDNSKLFLYKSLKLTLDQELYLDHPNFNFRKNITKMRISDHNLFIEKGRYSNIPRDERTCSSCKVVEDEKHFLIECKINENFREAFLIFLYTEYPELNNMNNCIKLKHILNPSTPSQVNKLGSYIKKSLELRTGDS